MTDFIYRHHLASDLPRGHDWSKTLGIEVTLPAIAVQCGLGNLDPQHTPNAQPEAPAAIEAALELPLPEPGTHLVTIRPDPDAIGAMAVLELRARGKKFHGEMLRRVGRIAAADRFAQGPWPGPRPLPDTVRDILEDAGGEDMALLAACAFDWHQPLSARMATVSRWLCEGGLPLEYRGQVIRRANALLISLWLGATRVNLAADGRIASVVSEHPQALRLGYRLAPVVVALNPSHRFPGRKAGRKLTLARWSEGDCDLNAVVRHLEQLEPGWGGQAGIKGSPQTGPSQLALKKVIDLVATGLPDLTQREECA